MSTACILGLSAAVWLVLLPVPPAGAEVRTTAHPAGRSAVPKIGIVLQPYTARPGADEVSIAPGLLYPELVRVLKEIGVEQSDVERVELTPDEEAQYGLWHRISLADAHLGRVVASTIRQGSFPLGLLGNCISSWGMLAGLQHSGPSPRSLRVGLIWIDAHGDFNTPETTLSGWLGGMPVSVAAGQSLFRLRLKAGVEPPISTRDIIMMGLRDVDPFEQVLIDESHVTTVSTEEMLDRGPRLRRTLDRLSQQVDAIYLHIDLDILDATAIPGSFFPVSGGPTATQLAEPVRLLMQNPKVKALGVASFPTGEQGRKTSMESTLTLIRAAVRGFTERQP